MTFEESLHETQAPKEVQDNLALLTLPFSSFSGTEETGQLLVHRALAEDVQGIFKELFLMRFPIEKMVPIVAYDWDDEASMQDNNTSSFNYRPIMGTERLSNHSWGFAVDINPRTNPYFARDGKVYPLGATYDTNAMGAITSEGPVVALFKRYGWDWGGDWTSVKDYQHFEKVLS